MNTTTTRRRRQWQSRSGPLRACQGLGHAWYNLYHRLSTGSWQQRQKAEELKTMILEIPKLILP